MQLINMLCNIKRPDNQKNWLGKCFAETVMCKTKLSFTYLF